MNRPWSPAKLYEILTPISRAERIEPMKTYRLLGVRLEGAGPFHRETIMGSQSAATTLYEVKSGDFIYSRLFACRGAFGVISSDLDGCYVSGEFPTFIPVHDKVDVNFLRLWFRLSTTIREVDANCTGSTPLTRNRFKENFFLNLEIQLPPLGEQRRIVAKIQELAAKIGEARGLRQRSVVEIETLISSAGKHFFSAKDLEHLIRLEVLTTRITKGESPEWQGSTYQDSGPFFVRSENVLWGKFDKSKQVHIPVEFHEKLSRSQLCAGDVLINLVGASIGRSCVVPDDLGKANVNQAVAVISPDQKQLDSKFLMHFLISEPAQKTIHGGKVETARPNISLTDLRNLMIPVYSLNEQLRIVAYLDGLQGKVDAVKNVQDHTAAELNALLPSILDKAFKGEL